MGTDGDMTTDAWAPWIWPPVPGPAASEQRVAEWVECLASLERFYERLAAAWGTAFAPPTAAERLATARWAAWTGARPSMLFVRWLQLWP
jgi:hypothetical protein